ncbi:hypothetical protein DSUL_30033 [Desulfovibrionales bacterium]
MSCFWLVILEAWIYNIEGTIKLSRLLLSANIIALTGIPVYN